MLAYLPGFALKLLTVFPSLSRLGSMLDFSYSLNIYCESASVATSASVVLSRALLQTASDASVSEPTQSSNRCVKNTYLTVMMQRKKSFQTNECRVAKKKRASTN